MTLSFADRVAVRLAPWSTRKKPDPTPPKPRRLGKGLSTVPIYRRRLRPLVMWAA